MVCPGIYFETLKEKKSSAIKIKINNKLLARNKRKNWITCVQDHEKWKKEVVEKAKTFSN